MRSGRPESDRGVSNSTVYAKERKEVPSAREYRRLRGDVSRGCCAGARWKLHPLVCTDPPARRIYYKKNKVVVSDLLRSNSGSRPYLL